MHRLHEAKHAYPERGRRERGREHQALATRNRPAAALLLLVLHVLLLLRLVEPLMLAPLLLVGLS